MHVGQELTGSYQGYLVMISIMVTIFTTYTAMNLLSRMETNWIKETYLLLLSSIVLGGGIWTMHYIGMEAFHLGMPVLYNDALLILSFLFPVTSSILSFWLLWHFKQKRNILLLSSIIFGTGIVGMHYLGMESMEMNADITYNPFLYSISIIIGYSASFVGFNFFPKYLKTNVSKKILGSVVFGVAVSSMHYIGMLAATFTVHYHGLPNQENGNFHSILVFVMSLFALFIFSIILFTSLNDEQIKMRLKESEDKYRRLVEYSPIGIAIHNFGPISYMNPAGLKIVKANDIQEVIGKNLLEFIHPKYHDIVKERWETIRYQNESVSMIEEQLIRLDDEIIDVEIMAIPIETAGQRFVQIFFQDITERKHAERTIKKLAYQDPLTGLPNRRLFMERLKKFIKEIQSNQQMLAVMFMDLDGFKQINDTYGHDMGDAVLMKVAKDISNCMRNSEDTVSRLAGDEFAVILPNVSKEETLSIAGRLIQIFNRPMEINGNILVVTLSIGIAFSKEGEESANTLLKQADEAMYVAKRTGKNNVHVYSP